MLYEGIPVPIFCKGVILRPDPDRNQFEVQIVGSTVGGAQGPIMASLVYSPGDHDNYRRGDFVKVIVYMQYFPDSDKYEGAPSPQFDNHIIGKFDPEPIMRGQYDHPITKPDQNTKVFRHRKSGAGLACDSLGKLYLTSGGSVRTIMSPYGFGTLQNAHISDAMNFFRIITHNTQYLSREHFGFFLGIDKDEQESKTDAANYIMCFRRFVQQTGDIENWVSTCEGAWNPYVGPNNEFSQLSVSREVLYTRIINAKDKRITIEEGEPGDSFIMMRIDSIILGEGQVSSSPGASPATLGNIFKMKISDAGDIDIRAVGDETPMAPSHQFQLSIKDGVMALNFSGTITISHSDNDVSNNSIVIDPSKGIDITAKNGLRFNGYELATRSIVDWIDKYQTNLCQVTQIGGPAPIHPAALPDFLTGLKNMSEKNGFTTTNTGPAAVAKNIDNDEFSSV